MSLRGGSKGQVGTGQERTAGKHSDRSTRVGQAVQQASVNANRAPTALATNLWLNPLMVEQKLLGVDQRPNDVLKCSSGISCLIQVGLCNG